VFGYTPNYLRVGCVINQNESLENQIIKARLTAVAENYLVAQLAE
jgi:threonylcarbamoyladenosine tRNA methylthiotransferase MtaB